jgi:hypothetical protein
VNATDKPLRWPHGEVKTPLMKKRKTEKRVKALGWKDGTVAEFLGLTPQELALIEIKLVLSRKPA